MRNRTFLLPFRPILGAEVDVVIRCEKVSEFSILAEKLDSISVKTFFFFIFLETTCFWAERLFESPTVAEKSDSIFLFLYFFLGGDHLFLSGKNVFQSFPRNSVSNFGQTM